MERGHVDGRILTPGGWVDGRVTFAASVARIEPRGDAPADVLVLPGFVDLHVHGGAGADCMEGAEAVRAVACFHARHGTTALLATTVTAPVETILAAFRGIASAMAAPETATARVLGVHLEGPFISPAALGAQPPFTIPPDPGLLETLQAIAPIRVATFAPEIDGDGALLAAFLRHGVRAQIGHTACTYAQAEEALARGASGFTHLFNAMTGLHHRGAGCAGAALAHAEWAEIILDFQHVERGAVLAALRAVPALYGITDAVAAAGMPDGAYALGDCTIHKRGETVRLADGSLAGSILTMDRVLANFVALGLPLEEASRRVSSLPATYAGLEDRGRIVEGAAADLVVLDTNLRLRAVVAEGHPVPLDASTLP